MATFPSPAAGHSHPHGHRHGDDVSRPAPVRVGGSILRLSLGARLAVAGTLLAVLWIAVALVLGGTA